MAAAIPSQNSCPTLAWIPSSPRTTKRFRAGTMKKRIPFRRRVFAMPRRRKARSASGRTRPPPPPPEAASAAPSAETSPSPASPRSTAGAASAAPSAKNIDQEPQGQRGVGYEEDCEKNNAEDDEKVLAGVPVRCPEFLNRDRFS